MSLIEYFLYLNYGTKALPLKIKKRSMMIRKKLLCISLIYVLSTFTYSQELNLAINDWCPYICNPSAKKPGILIEIVEDIFQKEGYQVRFSKIPFNRAVVEIQNNRVQGIVGIVPEVMPSLIFPEEPVISTQFCFFTLPQSKWHYNSLTPYYPETRVAVVAGKKISSHIAKAFPNREAIYGVKNTSKRLIEMLNLQRIDAFIEDKTVILYLLQQSHPVTPLRMAGCVEEKKEYVAFSPTDPQAKTYAKIISDGIRRLRETGRIKEITASYIE